jgi:hypothetical protein
LREEEMNTVDFINTSLQRGARTDEERQNRFNGFSRAAETVETVSVRSLPPNAHLKQRVTDSSHFNNSTI